MTDPIRYGVNSSSPASPGLSGAIKDAVAAVADAVTPRSLRNRKTIVNDAVDGTHDPATIGRMRQGQSSDSNNDY